MVPARGMRVVLYLRVSTDKQVNDGHGLDAQDDRLRQYASDRQLDVIEVVVDKGLSGKTLTRPGVARILDLAESGAIDAVVCTKADRVSRSLLDLLSLGERLESHGVALITADEAVDTSTPLGKAMAQMRGVFAELERGMIAARTRDGMAAAKAKGIHVGRPPVGWRVVDGRWEPDPDRYPLVERAHAMRADGATQNQIAATFNSEGIATGSGKGQWASGNVSRLLKSPLVSEVAA